MSGTIVCSCGRAIATVTDLVTDIPTQEPIPEFDHPGSRDRVTVGRRVRLADGFVNARGHHPSGERRWYVRGPSPTRPSPAVRLPAMVTCGCGVDTLIPAAPEAAEWASLDRFNQREEMIRRLVEEGEDYVAAFGLPSDPDDVLK